MLEVKVRLTCNALWRDKGTSQYRYRKCDATAECWAQFKSSEDGPVVTSVRLTVDRLPDGWSGSTELNSEYAQFTCPAKHGDS